MRPRRPRSGITLLSLLVVVFILSLWAAVQVAQNADDRRRAVEIRAQAALKQIVSTEGVWRGTDSDRNGYCDYWTRDVAGFYALTDAVNSPLHYIDPQMAAADVAPGFSYAGMPVRDPAKGYYLRAMLTDETGRPYVDRTLPAVGAAPATGQVGTNQCRFGFCAYLSRRWGSPSPQFFVNENGVVYRTSTTRPSPGTTWPSADPRPPWYPAD